VASLVAAGSLVRRDGSVALARAEAPEGDAAKVASALLDHFPGDAWAMAHAAELLVPSDSSRADAVHAAALSLLADPSAKQEVRRRWAKLVANDAPLLLRAASRALDADAFDEARAWAEACARAGITSSEVYLVLGRALMGLGDLTGAKVALEGARSREAASPALKPAIAVELAELAFAKGMFDTTRAEADLARSGDTKVALRASNLLGKIRLAEGKWDEADAHFAGDAMTANAAGLAREALRARLNRAIAILSKGLLDEAELMLRAILADAERAEDQFACAYTLTNLAVVAWTRHDYGTALDCLERTFARRRALGSPATIRHTVASLAELRLRLGLFDHAAHTVAFGRRAPMSPADAAQFAIVAARISLAKADRDRCSSAARAAPARSSSPRRLHPRVEISPAPRARRLERRSRARHGARQGQLRRASSRRSCSPSSSATRRARSRAPAARAAAASRWPRAARSSSTRSATSRPHPGRAAPRAPREDLRARRRHTPVRANVRVSVRDPPRSQGDGRARRVPRGSLLPPARHRARGAPAPAAPVDLPLIADAILPASAQERAMPPKRLSPPAPSRGLLARHAGPATCASSRTPCARRLSSPRATPSSCRGSRRERRLPDHAQDDRRRRPASHGRGQRHGDRLRQRSRRGR
jgi:tetratricopeptide (TPR) repeat protein